MTELFKIVGKRVRYFRQLKGLTQVELADKAGIHYTYIGGIERGERNISMESFEKILNALEVSPSDFFNIDITDDPRNEKINLHQQLLKTRDTNEIILIHETVQKIINLIDKNQS